MIAGKFHTHRVFHFKQNIDIGPLFLFTAGKRPENLNLFYRLILKIIFNNSVCFLF